MEILIHDKFFEEEGLGQKLQAELHLSFRLASADLEKLMQSRRSLKCVYVPYLGDPDSFPEKLLSTTIMIGSDEIDPRVVALLEKGLADYVPSCRNLSYLVAKIRSVARRVREGSIEIVTDEVQQASGQTLTEKERRLLSLFLRVGEAGAARIDLTRACWPNMTVHQKTLDTHLFNLRRKLESAGYEVLFSQSRWRLRRPGQVPSPQGGAGDPDRNSSRR